jgi:hypothetical protein
MRRGTLPVFPLSLPKTLWRHPVPAFERTMKGRRLRIAHEVRDLSDAQRRLGDVSRGGFFTRVVQQFLVRDAFGGQAALESAARHSEVARERVDSGVGRRRSRRQRALDVERDADSPRQPSVNELARTVIGGNCPSRHHCATPDGA